LTKAPKKGGTHGIKWKNPHPRRQMNHLRGQDKPQGKHQVPEPPPITRSISNNERGGLPERRPSLDEPSPTATSRLKIEIAYTCYNVINTLYI
jgi:hypothetical protein